MKLFVAAALLLLTAPAFPATYYIANSGNDANAGTSMGSPWQTVKKLNAALLNAHAGDSFLLKRGDVFRDTYIFCGSQYQNTGGETVTTNPPKCSGSSAAPVTIGAFGIGPDPLIDAADPLSGKWELVAGTTYRLHLPSGAPLPLKLFVDPSLKNALQQQILPVPNFTGTCSPGTTYNYLDMWASSTTQALSMEAEPTPVKGCVGPSYLGIANPTDKTAVQGFAAGNTGLQNVEAGASAFIPKLKGFGYPTYPGVWYVNGSPGEGYTVYVNLADGSNPSAHVIEATHRNYGVFVEGANFVTVQDLAVAHSFESCALGIPYSDSDPVGEHLTFQRLRVFNCGSMRVDVLTPQHSHPAQMFSRGGIIVRASAGDDPPNLLSPAVLDSYVGTVDIYFGTDTIFAAGILLNGIDGGGPANHCVICGNFVSTTNSPGLNLTINLYSHSIIRNNGGRVSHNELTNNQSNIGFASIAGGMLDHNYIHKSYGQGIQLGGNSSSVDGGATGPVPGSQVIEYNTISNLGKNATLSLYNGIDCNSNAVLFSGFYEIGNTIVNTWGAGATFEGKGAGGAGCTAPHFWNNVIDQRYSYFGNGASHSTWMPSASVSNNSNALFLVNALHSNYDFKNNFYRVAPAQSVLVRTTNPSYTCADWVAKGPDNASTCNGADPLFANPANDDLRLQSASPLRAAGKDRADIGAFSSADRDTSGPGRVGQHTLVK